MRRTCLALASATLALFSRESTAQPVSPAPEARPVTPAPQQAPPAPAAPAPSPPQAASPAPAPAPAPSPALPAGGEKAPAAPSSPPEYYIEEQKKEQAAPGARQETEIYEPPPPPQVEGERPPPLKPNYIAPKTAFWAGLRFSYFVPYGTLWFDGTYNALGPYHRRLFSAYASPGPAGEVDVGVRLGRRYNVFAAWEHASLGPGDLDPDSFGGQQRGNSNYYGVGFRFSTNPDGLGFLLEIGLGYRDFRAYWSDGTKLTLSDSIPDGRIGLGADIRVNKWLSLEPMVVFGGGSFTTLEWSTHRALGAYDQQGSYGTFALQLGAHADVF
jgi:hypothetical protein